MLNEIGILYVSSCKKITSENMDACRPLSYCFHNSFCERCFHASGPDTDICLRGFTKLCDQFLIPRFKLGEPVALLKELNAARYPSLPGFDCLVIEARTLSDRQVISKQEGEDVALCSWKRHEWRKRKESLERLVESFDCQGVRHQHGWIGECFHQLPGLF